MVGVTAVRRSSRRCLEHAESHRLLVIGHLAGFRCRSFERNLASTMCRSNARAWFESVFTLERFFRAYGIASSLVEPIESVRLLT